MAMVNVAADLGGPVAQANQLGPKVTWHCSTFIRYTE